MLVLARARRFARRGKKVWVAALCAASYACGQYLFGDDSPPSESLLSQYLNSTKQVVAEVPPPALPPPPPVTKPAPAKAESSPAAIRSAFVPKSESVATKASPKNSELPEVAKFAATEASPIANDSAEQQARRTKSSRRVKSAEEPAQPASIAKTETPASVAPAAPAAPAIENKTLPTVAFLDVAKSTQPATEAKSDATPKPLIIENKPFIAATPLPLQREIRVVPSADINTASPSQIISVGRQSAAVPLNTQVVAPASAVGDDDLPPIVSPDSVPRPGLRKRPVTPPPPPTSPVLRIELGKK